MMKNRLSSETSPYLLQHAENPVAWYPWGEEAFARAREEDKPIFLSIGYSTCHWCHVMAHESFEDEEIAALLNRSFISIKVDREERPDIDSVYMAVCQAFTGSGGWPTSIFMTAEGKPFFAGTYFPNHTRGGMVGMKALLERIVELWDTDREALLAQADHLVDALQPSAAGAGQVDFRLLDAAAAEYRQHYDRENGGFGRAPKFPAPHNLLFLLGAYVRRGDREALEMAEHTLTQMYRGGIFDHIGYGFCRYATDARFLVPHFEKMLYDNALLLLAYSRAYAVTGKLLYREVAEKTASYVLREMTSPEGGFYSAQDADSDGEEGKYYVFVPEETIRLLGRWDGDAFNRHFDITASGNFEGKSIPNLLRSDVETKPFDRFLPELLAYRRARCQLHLDDKILTYWNALMIAALCELFRVTGDGQYLTAATRADRFLRYHLYHDGTLHVSYRAGKCGVPAFLDDYAGYLYAQLALYGATGKSIYLTRAQELCRQILSAFRDREAGGFYLDSGEGKPLIFRPKETYDGALPSGNSLMAWNLVRLAALTSDAEWEHEAAQQLSFLAAEAVHHPTGYSMYLSALLDHLIPPPKITVVLASSEDEGKLEELRAADAVVTVLDQPTSAYPLKNGKTTFYVCRHHTCLPPTNVWEEAMNSDFPLS